MQGNPGRGLFFAFEGIDRSGKSTLISRLVNEFKDLKFETMSFPDRSTAVGKKIDNFLSLKATDQKSLSPKDALTLHNLFSENRREKQDYMREKLLSGVNILVDRYTYSGAAYSVAQGADIYQCLGADSGLIAPDVVIHLELSPEAASKRVGYGAEVYENKKMQIMVAKAYEYTYKVLVEHGDIDLTPLDELNISNTWGAEVRKPHLFFLDASKNQDLLLDEAKNVISRITDVHKKYSFSGLKIFFQGKMDTATTKS